MDQNPLTADFLAESQLSGTDAGGCGEVIVRVTWSVNAAKCGSGFWLEE